MLAVDQLREFVIKPALLDITMYSPEAEELLVFTCANESDGCSFIKQVKGPALGIYQMEPETYNDIWYNYIIHKGSIVMQLALNFSAHGMPDEQRLIYDLRFASAMCRLHYARVVDPLPNASDANAIWDYYKLHYNTVTGLANKRDAISKYECYLRS